MGRTGAAVVIFQLEVVAAAAAVAEVVFSVVPINMFKCSLVVN